MTAVPKDYRSTIETLQREGWQVIRAGGHLAVRSPRGVVVHVPSQTRGRASLNFEAAIRREVRRMTPTNNGDLVMVTEAAERSGVHRSTLNRWMKEGKLQVVDRIPMTRGRYKEAARVRLSDVLALVAQDPRSGRPRKQRERRVPTAPASTGGTPTTKAIAELLMQADKNVDDLHATFALIREQLTNLNGEAKREARQEILDELRQLSRIPHRA